MRSPSNPQRKTQGNETVEIDLPENPSLSNTLMTIEKMRVRKVSRFLRSNAKLLPRRNEISFLTTINLRLDHSLVRMSESSLSIYHYFML